MAVEDKRDRRSKPLPRWQRLFFAIPVIGWIARDLAHGDKDTIWYALAIVVSLWIISAMTFGLPGLYVPAVIIVPVIFATLLLITWG